MNLKVGETITLHDRSFIIVSSDAHHTLLRSGETHVLMNTADLVTTIVKAAAAARAALPPPPVPAPPAPASAPPKEQPRGRFGSKPR